MSLSLPNAPTAAAPASNRLDHVLVSAFLENVGDLVHFKDCDGRFIAVSKSKMLRSGVRHRSEIIGKTDSDFLSEENARRAREEEDEIVRTGEAIVDRLEHVQWANGSECWSLVSKLPLRDNEGRIIGTLGIARDVTDAKRLEIALENSKQQLLEAAQLAGMAEAATGVLHSVGNVLNSLNVSASVVCTGMRQTKTESLAKIADLLQEHAGDLGHFLTADPQGRLVPGYIISFARHAADERARLLREIESLQHNVDHIKEIVSMQQSYATMAGSVENLSAQSLMEDALRMNVAALMRHEVEVVRAYHPVPRIIAERGKVLQILINLIRNAKYAADARGAKEKLITLRIEPGGINRVRLTVQDNGVGISKENIARIFTHGFTTKPDGHGFGLHSSVVAAREMNGSLAAHSDGPGLGASFTLELPVAPPAAAV